MGLWAVLARPELDSALASARARPPELTPIQFMTLDASVPLSCAASMSSAKTAAMRASRVMRAACSTLVASSRMARM
jgi:hypothetical protein